MGPKTFQQYRVINRKLGRGLQEKLLEVRNSEGLISVLVNLRLLCQGAVGGAVKDCICKVVGIVPDVVGYCKDNDYLDIYNNFDKIIN